MSSARLSAGHPFLLARFLLLVPLLISCGDGGTGPGKSGVGEEGGTVVLEGGSVTLLFPPGALSTYVDFTADPTASVPASDLIVPGSVFEIGPTGTTLERLVTLTLAYDPASLPDGVQESELRLQKVGGSGWEPTANSSVDTDRHTVAGPIESLGRFGVVGLSVATVESHPSFYILAVGETKQLTAVGKGPSGEFFSERGVMWDSNSESVATVDASGLVTAVGVGSATIAASVEGRSSLVTIKTYDCSAQSEIPATECQALVTLYDTMDPSDWRQAESLVTGPDPCDWYGVTCEGGSVSVLGVSGRQLPGSIPFSIGDFPKLKGLDLSTNRLSGPIPASIGTLTDLEFLNLGSNDLTGPIPPEFGDLSNLIELRLHWNLLTGPIPSELSNLSDLTDLRLDGNHLSGSIPPELGNLPSLLYLSLLDNQLSGRIPPELGGLANLQSLSLGVNQLSERIPPELGSLSKLTLLALRDNQLSGPIPPELGSLSNLQLFFLYGNEFTGAIPLSVAQLGGSIQSQFVRSDCKFVPPGNTDLNIPDTQEFRDADLDADGKICGVTIGFE